MTTSPDYDGPVYVGVEQDEPELVDADSGPVPAAGEREAVCDKPSPHLPHGRCEGVPMPPSWPAVPVGVHPEPAEEETPAETLLRDIFTDPAQRAVPVVHPEPAEERVARVDRLLRDVDKPPLALEPQFDPIPSTAQEPAEPGCLAYGYQWLYTLAGLIEQEEERDGHPAWLDRRDWPAHLQTLADDLCKGATV